MGRERVREPMMYFLVCLWCVRLVSDNVFILRIGRCAHYKRRCRIRAPCCNEIFDCRHCHNEIKVWLFVFLESSLTDHKAGFRSSVGSIKLSPLNSYACFLGLILQNRNEKDPLKRHDVPRHLVQKVQYL